MSWNLFCLAFSRLDNRIFFPIHFMLLCLIFCINFIFKKQYVSKYYLLWSFYFWLDIFNLSANVKRGRTVVRFEFSTNKDDFGFTPWINKLCQYQRVIELLCVTSMSLGLSFALIFVAFQNTYNTYEILNYSSKSIIVRTLLILIWILFQFLVL